jgi:hypothetical protein
MNDEPAKTEPLDIFETHATKSLHDQLIIDARLYTQSKDYKDLLDFVVRLQDFASFTPCCCTSNNPA